MAVCNALPGIQVGLGEHDVKAVWFHELGVGTTGQATVPERGTFLLDEFAAQVDAIVVGMSGVGGDVDWTQVVESDTTVVATTFDDSGNFVLTGVPSSYPVAVVFVYSVSSIYYDVNAHLIEHEIPGVIDHGQTTGREDDDHLQYHNDARAEIWHDADDHSGLLPLDHGSDIIGRSDDDHPGHLWGIGRVGGQTQIGGIASGENLILQSTSHATKGNILLGLAGNSAYDEVNDILGLGTNTPETGYHLVMGAGGLGTTPRTAMRNANSGVALPSAVNLNSDGDKWVFWNASSFKGCIGFNAFTFWFQSTGNQSSKFDFYNGSDSDPELALQITEHSVRPMNDIGSQAGCDIQFMNDIGTPGQRFHSSRIFSKFDGSGFANGRMTLQNPIGTNNWNDTLSIIDEKVAINGIDPVATFDVNAKNSSTVGQIIKGANGQSVALFQLLDNSDNPYIDTGDGLTASEFVGNIQGVDIDFRWQGSSEDKLFLIDAGNNQVRIGDGDTNYISVASTGDAAFVGETAGLPFGSIYVEGVDENTVLAAQDTYYQILAWSSGGAAGVNGESNNTTPDASGNSHVTIDIAGKYLVTWHVSAYSMAKNEYEFEIFANNGTAGYPGTESYRTTNVASAVASVSGQGICDFAANDTVELWVERKDGAAVSKTITIRQATISLVQIGGT